MLDALYSELQEEKDKERRRNMSDREVARENRMDPTKFKEKKKIRFLQKYYHKGVFFQDEIKELSKTHDWTAPTGEDAFMDKTNVPKAMQVKNFGFSSRSKYTHLVDQDTSNLKDNPFNQDRQLLNKLDRKRGGAKDGFGEEAKRRKL